MRFLFVVRFKEQNNGHRQGNTKTFKTVAKSQKAAVQKMHKKGQVISVRKAKRIKA